MNSIILPIKPKYTVQILKNSKKYEFRKKRCKKDIKIIYIYETAPSKSIVGEVEVIDILEGTPQEIWDMCNMYGGIEKREYDKYYINSDKAVAYKLGNVKEYEKSKSLLDFGIEYTPQSYVYVNTDKINDNSFK